MTTWILDELDTLSQDMEDINNEILDAKRKWAKAMSRTNDLRHTLEQHLKHENAPSEGPPGGPNVTASIDLVQDLIEHMADLQFRAEKLGLKASCAIVEVPRSIYDELDGKEPLKGRPEDPWDGKSVQIGQQRIFIRTTEPPRDPAGS